MANVKITDLSAGTALTGPEQFEVVQSANSVKITASQIKTFTGDSVTINDGTIGSVVITNSSGSFDSLSITSGAIPFATMTGRGYGYFVSTRDQTFISGSAMVISVDTSATFSTGVRVESSTQITMATSGVYFIGVTAQLANSDSSDHDASLFFKKNGTNIAFSNTRVTVPKAADGGAMVLTIAGMEQFAASDYIEAWIQMEDSTVILDSTTASGVIPATPSFILHVQKVG
jgi:hypothetical protein